MKNNCGSTPRQNVCSANTDGSLVHCVCMCVCVCVCCYSQGSSEMISNKFFFVFGWPGKCEVLCKFKPVQAVCVFVILYPSQHHIKPCERISTIYTGALICSRCVHFQHSKKTRALWVCQGSGAGGWVTVKRWLAGVAKGWGGGQAGRWKRCQGISGAPH